MSAVHRKSDFDVEPLFLDRWSPRSFSEAVLDDDALYSLFEAARWSPSASNSQPWRFVYARRGGPGWDALVSTLNENNKRWAVQAPVLILILSKKTQAKDGVPQLLRNHSFDTGAAWASLAFQAHYQGLRTHAIGGYDRARARELLSIPDDFHTEILVAVGQQGGLDSLHPDFHEREKPNGRRSVSALVAEGAFTFTD